MPINTTGLAFVTATRYVNGNARNAFYLASVQEDGFIYFNDDIFWRCTYEGDFIQLFYIEKQIWIGTQAIDINSIQLFKANDLIRMANGGNAIIGTGVEAAITLACDIADDESHGYSQLNRNGNPDYDCSSLMYSVFRDAGFDLPSYNGTTYTMINDFTNAGFTWLSGLGNNVDELLRGDILLATQSHTELYIGNYQNVGAHSDENGGIYGFQPGDQGGEISVSGWYAFPWDGVLRWEHGDSVTPPNN